jgi:ABC-type taurine transport system substrate-binding protein
MKKSTHQLVSEKNLTGHVDFTPEFTKSEKNALRRFGYAPLPGSPYLHSSDGKWIEKVERVEYLLKHKGTKLEGVTETKRELTYFLIERRTFRPYLTTSIIDAPDFKSFVNELKKIHEKC